MNNTPLTHCPHCCAPLHTAPVPRRGRQPGIIEEGSVAEKVLDYLHRKGWNAELSSRDISDFATAGLTPTKNIGRLLATAVKYGYLVKAINNRGRTVYRLPKTSAQ